MDAVERGVDRPASMLRGALEEHLAAGDRPRAVAIAVDAVTAGEVPLTELYDELTALLVDVGTRWHAGELEVWQEHLATSTVRTIVESCASMVAAEAAPSIGRSVVLATPPEEYHDLGLRMLADRFALAGWTVHLLGASVPAVQLSGAVTDLGADAVALSVSTHFHRAALRSYLAELRRVHAGLRVWVGGAAFVDAPGEWEGAEVLDPTAIAAITAEYRR
jgi:MerR family transcriptional regulator, light-induced transcriptional regulator